MGASHEGANSAYIRVSRVPKYDTVVCLFRRKVAVVPFRLRRTQPIDFVRDV